MSDVRAAVILFWVFAGCGMCGKYNYTTGGTRLNKMPAPYLVLITPDDIYDEEPHPDCVGTYIGSLNSAEDQKLALTSLYSSSLPWAEVRTARQEVFTANPIHYRQDRSRFGIEVIQLVPHRGEWIPEIVNVERSKQQFQDYMRKGNEDKTMYGFALAVNTNPVMVYTVSWDQSNCPALYRQLKGEFDTWPDELPEGTFCVFRGTEDAHTVINEAFFTITPATPCDDAIGSPVMLSDFSTLLGVIIMTRCGETEVAFAMSPAYLPEIIVPTASPMTEPMTTTTTTEPPPPLPRVPLTSGPCAASSSTISGCLQFWSAIALYGLFVYCWSSNPLV